MTDMARCKVREFIVTNSLFGDSSCTPTDEESLLGAGVVDSTGVLKLVEFLETDLGVPVADQETVRANPDNIAAFVGRKQAAISA